MIKLQNYVYSVKTFSSKAELQEHLYGVDNRPSYTKQQLLKMGFKEEFILSRYFEQSSDDISNPNITFKMKRDLKVDGVELKTVYELLDALNSGKEVTYPSMKPDYTPRYFRATAETPEETVETDNQAEDTPQDTPNKTKLQTGKGEESSKQYVGCSREILFIKGFTNKQISMYFDEKRTVTFSGREKTIYVLKENIIINGQKIRTVQELIDALEITPETNKGERFTLKDWLNLMEANN